MMKIAVATVFYEEDWKQDASDIGTRLQLMDEIVGSASETLAVDLPAGFFRIRSKSEMPQLLRDVEAVLRGHDRAVLWGIDVGDPVKETTKQQADPCDPDLPHYVFLRLADGSMPLRMAQQLAATSNQAVHFSSLPADRVVRVGRKKLGVLICGELLAGVYGRGRTARWTRDVARDANVVLDLAHANVAVGGPRNWMRAIENCSEVQPSKRPVMIAQHLAVRLLDGRKCGDLGEAPRVASSEARSRHVPRREVGSLGDGTHPAAVVDVYAV